MRESPMSSSHGCVRSRCLRSRRSQRCRRALHHTKPDIWCLPEEVSVLLLRGLHVKDLLNLRSTHPHFRNLLDSNCGIWTSASFRDVWPTLPNMKHFQRAAEAGNISALVKLGLAYLYNEGFPGNFIGKQITSNGEHAAELFCRVETLTPSVAPFTWLFIRPPWATSGTCCKECVFVCMKKYAEQHDSPSVHVCVARTLSLLEDPSLQVMGAQHLQDAVTLGSSHAAFLQWQDAYQQMVDLDQGHALSAIRELRNIATSGCQEAVLELCNLYAGGRYGGVPRSQAAAFVREFVQSTKPTGIQQVFQNLENRDITSAMRYILVDWLVEVAGMKDFSSLTLHVAINVVDRFLMLHPTSRCRLQLLGVSAMVLCSRFLGKDIITIREAAWLTDNTYKYEDVVRMMGEITATLAGNLRVLTTLDLTQLLGRIIQADPETQCVAEYICEMALLQSDLGQYPLGEVAAGCTVLARMLRKLDSPWPDHMYEFTGYQLQDIAPVTRLIHSKCFVEAALVDHREILLQAVANRYNEERFYKVSQVYTSLCTVELQSVLGLPEPCSMASDSEHQSESEQEEGCHADLIMSPSRRQARSPARCSALSEAREQAATPTLNESRGWLNLSMSGYDGDLEDEGESFLETEDESDCDMPSLWCGSMRTRSHSSGIQGDNSDSDSDIPSNTLSPLTPRITINLPGAGCFASPTLICGSKSQLASPAWNSNYLLRGGLSCYTDSERSFSPALSDKYRGLDARVPVPCGPSAAMETTTVKKVVPGTARDSQSMPSSDTLCNQSLPQAIPITSTSHRAKASARPALQTLNINPAGASISAQGKLRSHASTLPTSSGVRPLKRRHPLPPASRTKAKMPYM